jgi:hypothetical protein
MAIEERDVVGLLREVLARLERVEAVLLASRKGGRKRIDTVDALAEHDRLV